MITGLSRRSAVDVEICIKTATVQKRGPFWFIIKKELSPCLSKRLHYPLTCRAADNAASFTSWLSIFFPADNTAARSLARSHTAAVRGTRNEGIPFTGARAGLQKVNRQFGAYRG